MWYEWNSLREFDVWHKTICDSLGIPNGITTAYTESHEVEGKYIAVVHDSEAGNLTPTILRPLVKVIE